MIDTIVFSKNRAMQLDLMLRTAQEYAPQLNLKCLYTYTNDKHKKSYEILKGEHLGVQFIFEQNMKEQIIDAITTELMCFLVDDDIFFKRIPDDIKLKPFETYSVRLGNNIQKESHFNYRISVDGNIFHGETMKSFLQKLSKDKFITPNRLEAALMGNYNDKMTLLYETQCLVGLAHNRVSSSSTCSYTGKYEENKLCEMYNNGYKIITNDFDYEQITNVHDSSIEYIMIKDERTNKYG